MKLNSNNIKSHILSAISFDKSGKAYNVSPASVASELLNSNLTWVHLDANHNDAKSWLEEKVLYLDHLIIDALFANETRPRIMEFDTGMLIILRGVNLDKNSEVEDMVSIRLWIDKYRIISVQRRDFTPIYSLIDEVNNSKKIKNSAEFLYNLIYKILSLTTPVISELNDKIDIIEDQVYNLETDNKLREKVTNIRKKTTIFKRYMLPQKDVINQLKVNEYDWVDDWAIRHFQENYDQICHLIEEIDEAKERAQIIQDELYNAIADKVNRSMFKISLVASIFMPLSFVAALFGMNVGGIPGENSQFGFYAICYFLAVAFGLIFLTLKRKKIV
jgi:zinc transporter